MDETSFAVRQARRADAPAMHDLHTASVTTLCATLYPLSLIHHWIADRTPEGYCEGIDRGEMFVCEADGEIAGFGHAVSGAVLAIFAHPQWVRQGVGSMLLSHAIELARRDHDGPIKVEATLNARQFYEHHGFVETSRYAVQRGGVDVPVVEMVLHTNAPGHYAQRFPEECGSCGQ
jgi:GNAT superfamily N-acetyltransferase